MRNKLNVKSLRVVGEIRVVDGGGMKELNIYLDENTKNKIDFIIRMLESRNYSCELLKDKNGETYIHAEKFLKARNVNKDENKNIEK